LGDCAAGKNENTMTANHKRLKLRRRDFALVALVTIMLCVGLNVGIFAAFHSMLLPHLPFPTPDQLVTILNATSTPGVERRPAAI
jgi:hypothetical protein